MKKIPEKTRISQSRQAGGALMRTARGDPVRRSSAVRTVPFAPRRAVPRRAVPRVDSCPVRLPSAAPLLLRCSLLEEARRKPRSPPNRKQTAGKKKKERRGKRGGKNPGSQRKRHSTALFVFA